MADSLSLLRQFTIEGKHIEERDDQIIFNEFSWNKDSLTNFISYSAERKEKEYYSLGCLLYFLKNENLSHPKYVQQSAADKVPVVRRPDRRTLLEYLHGKDTQHPKSIDKTARLEMPTHVKRTADDQIIGPAAKKTKLDAKASQQQIEQRLAEKLKAPQNAQLSINSSNFKDLSDKLNADKLAAIRAKIIAQRRTRIKPEDEDAKAPSLGAFLESRGEGSSIFRNEKQWRTRTTILQSTGKTFSKTITAILSSVKAREEGKVVGGKPPQLTPRPGAPTPIIPSQTQPRTLPNYNRYDQEQFHGKNQTHGFNIETTGTFSGMTLRNVTEGVNQGAGQQRPGKQPPPQPNKNSNGVVKSGGIPPSIASPNTPNSGGKRVSRTPIIVISAAPKSLITMFNAKEILQDLRFVSSDEMRRGGKRENELLITRRKEGGLTVPYRVIDNPSKLTPADWDRVVAVFVMGQVWQFKGWPWDGNPTVIFSKICGFHLKWDEMVLEKNIANWSVNTIQLSRTKRHLDRARLMVFWEVLDRYLVNNKPHLRF